MTATVTAPGRAPRAAAGLPMGAPAPRLLPRPADLSAVYELDEFDGVDALYQARHDSPGVTWTSYLWKRRAAAASRFVPEGGTA